MCVTIYFTEYVNSCIGVIIKIIYSYKRREWQQEAEILVGITIETGQNNKVTLEIEDQLSLYLKQKNRQSVKIRQEQIKVKLST